MAKEPGLLESMKQEVSQKVEAVRGTAIAQVAGKMWDALQPAFEAGAHEAAAALFRGDAFVMYPQAEKQMDTMHGLRAEAQQNTMDGRTGHDRDHDRGR